MWAQELGLLDGGALDAEMPDIKPGYVRGPQQLGSSLLQWQD